GGEWGARREERGVTNEETDVIRQAYDALLERVAAGEITKTDPVEVLAGLDSAWTAAPSAVRLAADLLDYAREQANGPSHPEPAREQAWRQRLYAITQQLYERLRLSIPSSPPGTPTAI